MYIYCVIDGKERASEKLEKLADTIVNLSLFESKMLQDLIAVCFISSIILLIYCIDILTFTRIYYIILHTMTIG